MVLFDANKPEKGQSSYMDEKGAGEPGAGHFNVYDHASLSLSLLPGDCRRIVTPSFLSRLETVFREMLNSWASW